LKSKPNQESHKKKEFQQQQRRIIEGSVPPIRTIQFSDDYQTITITSEFFHSEPKPCEESYQKSELQLQQQRILEGSDPPMEKIQNFN
jgi:hypothetical protein